MPAIAVVAFVRAGFWIAEAKAEGPVQLYVAPATAVVERLIVLPVQTGVLLNGEGVAGVVFTTTTVVPTAEVHPFAVTVTLYVPAIAIVAFTRVGFCNADENEEGPVHEYVAPATADVKRLIVLPVHTGELLEGAGVAGVVLTATVVVIVKEHVDDGMLTTQVYVPAMAAVAFARVGLAAEETNPPGPVHEYVATLDDGEEVKLIVLPVHTGELLAIEGGEHEAALIGVLVVPGTGQPEPSKMSGLLPLLQALPETLPVPKIYERLLMMLSHCSTTQSVVAIARNLICVLSVPSEELFICPPVTELAPVPTLTLTTRDAAIYSAWSSPEASVLLPLFGP